MCLYAEVGVMAVFVEIGPVWHVDVHELYCAFLVQDIIGFVL
jgi:metal-dependent HD superfamily phosphatase/phosphodiesterase